MSYAAHCPQCLFVTRQLGHPTPCLLHLSLERARGEGAVFEPDEDYTATVEAEADYDEPYAFGQLRPTVDRPGPFSLRQYVRLQLLRSRIQANPSPLDQAGPRSQVRTLSRR